MSNLYVGLAKTSMKNGRQFYLPYFLTGALTVAMFYIMVYLASNRGLSSIPGNTSLAAILFLGCIVIGIFAFIFLYYTNSFIIKRRKKELGLYNILGMEKRHIAKVVFLETLFNAVLSIAGGLLFGTVFSKLLTMFLYKLAGLSESIQFYVSVPGVIGSMILFGIIYASTLIYNLIQIGKAKPIDLLHSENAGEKEPKTKILMTIVGALCLAGGYYIAVTTENPISALSLFFVAVVLVIIGTYCLFTAGSIAVLKLLRKNKNFYYKSNHFTAVSGMMYRMKQNAVGLANICILSTMVLVMVSTTVSLYFGAEDELSARYPSSINATIRYTEEIGDATPLVEQFHQKIAESGRTITGEYSYSSLMFTASLLGDGTYDYSDNAYKNGGSNVAIITFMTREDFIKMTQNEDNIAQIKKVKEGTVEVIGFPKYQKDTFSAFGKDYPVSMSYEMNKTDMSSIEGVADQCYYVLVDSQDTLQQIFFAQKEQLQDYASDLIQYVNIDIDGTEEEKLACESHLYELNAQHIDGPWKSFYMECRDMSASEFYGLYGGLFFLGLFLGTMFLMVTVLIIFYKQISEGYDDKMRFQIMEKVGMSNREVKRSIRSQVRIVFFLPLVTAAIHVGFAFPMISRILKIFGLTNITLFVECMAGTILIFGAIYYFVFKMTSRTYYKIVGNQIR